MGLFDVIKKVGKTNLDQGQSAITSDLRRTTMNVLGQGAGGLIGTPQRIPDGNGDGVQARPASPAASSPITQQLLNRNGLGQQQPTSVGGAVGGFIDRSVGTAERLIMPSDAAKRRVEYGVATTGATLNGAATAVRGAVSDTPSQGLSENSPPQPAQPEQRSWWQRNITDRFSGPTAAATAAVAVAATPAAALPEQPTPQPVVATMAASTAEPLKPIARETLTALPTREIQQISAVVPAAVVASTLDTTTPPVVAAAKPTAAFAAVAAPAETPAPVAPAAAAPFQGRFSEKDAGIYERAMAAVNAPKPGGMG